MTPPRHEPDLGELDILDLECDSFEAAWTGSNEPRLEDWLNGAQSSLRGTLVRELLQIEFEIRLRRGETLDVTAYATRLTLDDAEIENLLVATTKRLAQDHPLSSETLLALSGITLEDAAGSCGPEDQVVCHQKSDLKINSKDQDGTTKAIETSGQPLMLSPVQSAVDPCSADPSVAGTFSTDSYPRGSVSSGRGVQTIGRFQLQSIAGRGGCAVVWKAYDPDLDRIVALKVPYGWGTDMDQCKRFLREARATARLKHPHIVQIHEIGFSNGLPFIVADFIEGISLAGALQGPAPDHRAAVELCVKLADALHFAHEAGIIHRDVKPGNILLDNQGEPYLTDFGLSRRSHHDPLLTSEGSIFGTPSYMSPEQARGEGHRADGRADVFSLGVIFYQLLTGELPFKGTTASTIEAVAKTNPPAPRSLDSSIPVDLETICLKALEKSPENRFATAAEFAEDLRRWLTHQPIQARSANSFTIFRRWCLRHQRLLASALAITLMICVAVIWIRMRGQSLNPSPKELERMAGEALNTLHTGDSRQGIAELTQAIKSDPRPEWLCERAYGKIRLGDADGALVDCQALLAKHPQHPRAHYLRYLALRSQGRFKEAMAELNIAVLLDDPLARTEKEVAMRFLKKEQTDRESLPSAPKTSQAQ